MNLFVLNGHLLPPSLYVLKLRGKNVVLFRAASLTGEFTVCFLASLPPTLMFKIVIKPIFCDCFLVCFQFFFFFPPISIHEDVLSYCNRHWMILLKAKLVTLADLKKKKVMTIWFTEQKRAWIKLQFQIMTFNLMNCCISGH